MYNLEGKLSADAIKNINIWLNESKYQEYKSELISMIESEKWQELEDSFFQVVSFGTAGIRGRTGLGSNRINRITIGQSAQALCEYILNVDDNAAQKGIVIAYDTRITSDEFSKVAASVVAANGFKTYLFDGFRATPELSFAVRHLGCAAGIVISASHNPPLDNGFKAYWSDGGQLVAPHDKGIVNLASNINVIKSIDFNEAKNSGLIQIIGQEIDDIYIQTVTKESLGSFRDLNIVYSPLHGAGQRNTLPALRAAGFDKVSVVLEQMTPDGNFPTIPSGKPNPEEVAANDMAVQQMLAENADIAITNDPDADRIGIMVNQAGEAIYLNGNQSAILAFEYSLRKMAALGELTPKHYVTKTIVTTDLLNSIATKYGIKCYDNLLIGFKYIAELIRSKEAAGDTFVIGGEESFGMLKGSYARDKDAASGSLILAECAAELKTHGKTLWDGLMDIYRDYGIYTERLDTMVCSGASGFEKMQRIMAGIRTSAPQVVGGQNVTAVLDYSTLQKIDLISGIKTDIDCTDKGNVIVLEFGDRRRRVTIRPSGTEPKIKFYVQWYQEVEGDDIEKQYTDLSGKLGLMNKELEDILSKL